MAVFRERWYKKQNINTLKTPLHPLHRWLSSTKVATFGSSALQKGSIVRGRATPCQVEVRIPPLPPFPKTLPLSRSGFSQGWLKPPTVSETVSKPASASTIRHYLPELAETRYNSCSQTRLILPRLNSFISSKCNNSEAVPLMARSIFNAASRINSPSKTAGSTSGTICTTQVRRFRLQIGKSLDKPV
jgi:hypothetical protein